MKNMFALSVLLDYDGCLNGTILNSEPAFSNHMPTMVNKEQGWIQDFWKWG